MTNIEPGKELGRYELLVPLARGGMAEVWAARLQGSRGFTKLVAVKVILPGGMDNERLEEMFLEEASLAALIHHPNVVETLELGEHEGTLYLVMEWVEGEPLRYVQNRAEEGGGLPLTVAVNLMGQACKGLHAAHELCGEDGRPLGLVHRDISPQNILVTYTGAVKIVDFGIAKATGRVTSLTEAGEIKGKVSYMSPEQLRGGALDRRSDVFALGILLFLLTTGTHPFKGANPGETVRRIACNEIVARPSELVPDYPEALEAVVLKALSHDVNERWATARDLLVALEAALPQAFEISAENDIRQYLTDLLGERARQRRDAVRVAREVLRNGKAPAPFAPPKRSAENTGSSPGRGSPSVAPASAPTARSPVLRLAARRRLLVGAASGLALFGALGLGAHLVLGSPDAQHTTTSAAVPSSPAELASPTSLTDTPSTSRATPPSLASIEPVASDVEESTHAATLRTSAPGGSSDAGGSSSASSTRANASGGRTNVHAGAGVPQRPTPRKPSRDPWDPKSFGSRH